MKSLKDFFDLCRSEPDYLEWQNKCRQEEEDWLNMKEEFEYFREMGHENHQ